MEAWREELYHGLFSNLRARFKSGKASSASSGSSARIVKSNNSSGTTRLSTSGGTTNTGNVGGKAGRTWKKHKYIRIENGKYIYPEDLEKQKKKVSLDVTKSLADKVKKIDMSKVTFNKKESTPVNSKSKKSSGRSSGSSSGNTTATQETKPEVQKNDKGSVETFKDLPKKPELMDMYTLKDINRKVYWDGKLWVPEDKKKDESEINIVNKGSVKTFEDLPEKPEVGEMYLIEDLDKKVYWDGELWVPKDETEKKSSESSTNSSSYSSTSSGSNKTTKKTTSSSTITTSTVKDSHQESWDARKAAGQTTATGKLTSSGEKAATTSLKTLVSNVVSNIKSSTVNSGAKAVSKIISKSSKSGGGGR